MLNQINKKKAIASSLLIFSTLLIFTPSYTFAVQPETVDVEIIITDFDTLRVDRDVGAADVYFLIKHDSGNEGSNTAQNDYYAVNDYDLSNSDFDGSGYYDVSYSNVDLDTGDLTWIIEVWDEDAVFDDLLYKGILTIKDPGSTGTETVYPYAYGQWTWISSSWVPIHYGTTDTYHSFSWIDGPDKDYGVTRESNGLKLEVELIYSA